MATINYDPNKPSNLPTDATTKTTRYFNNFYVPSKTVSSNTNDAIVSFFEERSNNLESAKLLAQAVIDTAFAQRLDPLTVLDEFKNLDTLELNAYLALYLNTSRVNTSLLGIRNVPQANQYVTRSILS